MAGAYILPTVLGPRFGPSSAPFAVLVVAFGLQVWLQPIGALLYWEHHQAQDVELAFFKINAVLGFGVLGFVAVCL